MTPCRCARLTWRNPPVAENAHTVLVRAAVRRLDVAEAVRTDAGKVDAQALVADAVDKRSVKALQQAILTEAVRASVAHIKAQAKDSADTVKAEMVIFRKTDPATVRAVTAVDVAAERAAAIKGDA